MKPKVVLLLSLLLIVLVVLSSYQGIFVTDTYSREAASWLAQAIGQDIINLFVVCPFLLITALLFYIRTSETALLLWSGVIFYLIYTFVIYCFAVHFNKFFIIYCFILGLSFYSFMYFLLYKYKKTEAVISNSGPVFSIAIYLTVIGCIFYLLWLSEVIPSAINNTIPKEIIDSGLTVNPVHALDLSVCLPAIIITAILLLKKELLGYLLTPAMLVFSTLMNITIGGLVAVTKQEGIQTDWLLILIMSLLAVLSIGLLINYLRGIRFV